MPSQGWTNIHWELQQKKYNLTINVKKILPEIEDDEIPGPRCNDSSIYDGNLQGAQITVRDDIEPYPILFSGTSNNDGNVTFPVWINQGDIRIYADKQTTGFTPESYLLKCPEDINLNYYTYNPGTVGDGDNRSQSVGLRVTYKDGWVSAIDSDIFANKFQVSVPLGQTDNSDTGQIVKGYAKTLINSLDNSDNSLGFLLSESSTTGSLPSVGDPCPNKKVYETNDSCSTNYGAHSYNLTYYGNQHDSKWLEDFTFKAPTNALNGTSDLYDSVVSGVILLNSGVYDIPAAYVNSVFDMLTGDFNYRIVGGNLAILYVRDVSGTLNIPKNIISTDSTRLLLIVDGSVTIDSDIGTNMTSLNIINEPQIEAGIIAKDKITFESIGGLITASHYDKPIVVSAPLITRDDVDGIEFLRDLYHYGNDTTPAESVKAFNKYIYLLSALERTESQDNLYYTGLTTYDLDWEYIY